MKFCTKCGKSIDDQAAFCPYCGTASNANVTQSPVIKTGLHCPKCKGVRLSAMTEAVASYGSATAVGKRSVATSSTIRRRHSWVCSDCGHIFRNIEEWEAEIPQNYRIFNIIMSVCWAFAILIGLWVGSVAGFGPGMVVVGIFAASWAGTLLLSKKARTKEEREAAALRKACFD